MEHLLVAPLPNDTVIEINYLGSFTNFSWDGGDFLGFPARAGWDTGQLLRGLPESVKDRTPRDLASFIQQWLWLGAIASFFSPLSFSNAKLIEDFTRTSHISGRQVITTEKLPVYLDRWMNDINLLDQQSSSQRLVSTDEVLVTLRHHIACYMGANAALSKVSDHLKPVDLMQDHLDIALSVILLAEVLMRAKLRAWKPMAWPGSKRFQFQRSQFVLESMARDGWCPCDITMLRNLMTSSGMCVASLLRPRLAHEDHHAAGCDKNFCQVMNITGLRKEQYETKHWDGCDKSCGFHSLEKNDLSRSLSQKDKFPVTTYAKNGKGGYSLQIRDVSVEDPIAYVAISHVWAEGLGNTRDNALPHCQLLRIQDLVDRVTKEDRTPFWIDTLSVPQSNGREDLEQLRRDAVTRMKEVYKCSSAVLVLDSEFLSVPGTASIEESLLRFACSSWLRRLWTLQEAILGRRVMLQFQDIVVDMDGLFSALANISLSTTMHQVVISELISFVQGIITFRQKNDIPWVTKTWNACQYRDTSELHDEPICLAILLGLDEESLKVIINTPEQQRWETFLLRQKEFPKDILFSLGPRCSQPGFRWAPRNFIRRPATQTAIAFMALGTGFASPEGLTIPSHGFIFKVPPDMDLPEGPIFYMVDESSQIVYRLQQTVAQDDPSATSWETLKMKIAGMGQLALVINHSLEEVNDGRNPSAMAVLVEVKSGLRSSGGKGTDTGKGTMIHGRFLTTMSFALLVAAGWPDVRKWLARGGSMNDETKHICRVVAASATPGDQKWCIG